MLSDECARLFCDSRLLYDEVGLLRGVAPGTSGLGGGMVACPNTPREWAARESTTGYFLVVVCIVLSLLCGQAPQGTRCFNTQFLCGVLMLFILPLPALAGTLLALRMFKRATYP